MTKTTAFWPAALLALVPALLVLAGTVSSTHAEGSPVVRAGRGIPVLFQHGDKIERIATLPNKPEYAARGGGKVAHYDIGYKWTQLSVFWIPIWAWGGSYCGYVDDETFVSLDEGEVKEICAREGIPVPEGGIPFMRRIGGYLILGLIGIGILSSILGKMKRE